MADKVIFLTTTGAGTWTVPADWTNTNKVECIGGGGGGRVAAAGGGGGGGGAYSSVSNIATLSPAQVVNVAVGAGNTSSTAGGDTWFGATTLAASLVGAKGGGGATSATGAAGGASASGFPTSGGVRNSGGAGGNGNATVGVETGGGGGGAGGPGGVGGLGGNGDATASGADFGGGGGSGAGLTTAGGAGGAGTTSAGAGGTNATGGGPGGAGGSGNGVSAGGSGGVWSATHQADGTTTSNATAAPGGGGGGGGSAANGFAGSGAFYGGGGGGRGQGTGAPDSLGSKGIIVITYTTAAGGAANVTGSQTLSATTQTSSITVPAGAALFMRPSSDASTGGWTNEAGGTTLFASLDETSASDSDYIQSGLTPTADVAEVHLSDPTGALASATLRLRVGKAVNDATVINIVAALVQGATVIASWTYADVAFGYTLKTETLTAPQLAAITNANDLRIRFTADTVIAAGLTPPEGTNLLANENDLSHSQYNRAGFNLIVNADGVADGIAYLPGGSSAQIYQYSSVSVPSVTQGHQYRVSLKVKKPTTLGVRYVVFEADETNIVNGSARVAFDLDTSSVVAAYVPTAPNTSAGVLDLGDGYKMCWLKYIHLTTYAGVLTWHPGDGSGAGYSEIGDGVTPNQLWKGWKLEYLGPP